MRIRARHYATAEPIELDWANGSIRAVGPLSKATVDVEAGWVAPALFDLQINGARGISFTSPTLGPAGVAEVVETVRRHGVGQFLPTLTTDAFSTIAHGLTTIRQACAQDHAVRHAVAGIHLEGPYLSAEDGPRGAHPREHIRPPDFDEFRRWQDAAEGAIRLVTLAPEWPGAVAFIERLTWAGVVVAVGHTAASGPQLRAAVAAGARLSTHLGNGCHAVLPRHPNYLWEQLADDALHASIICDGHHVPEAFVRCVVKMKSPERTVLTCDAGSLAGLPSGRYRDLGQEVEVLAQGKIVIPGTPYLAGAWAFTDTCVGNVLRFTPVSLGEAVDMAGAVPRRLLGLPAGRLEAGSSTDLVLFDWGKDRDFEVRRVISADTPG